jgi:hypothetical protein
VPAAAYHVSDHKNNWDAAEEYQHYQNQMAVMVVVDRACHQIQRYLWQLFVEWSVDEHKNVAVTAAAVAVDFQENYD